MKTSSGAKGKKLDRGAAAACVAMNLLATPGLGTIIAGRPLAGAIQLLAAIIGFCEIIAWFFYLFQSALGTNSTDHGWLWQTGALFFAAGWLGSLWSSIGILRDAKSSNPPKLDGTPG